MTAIISFLAFTGLVGLITWFITHKDDHDSSTGFFLAGRSLTFPLIAGSLLLTNLSTEQMVGLNGAAFTDGLCVMVWEVVAVIALVAMALFFLPKFLKSGIATLPQYLEIRFDHKTRVITSMVFLIAYAVILLPIILYTGATGLIGMLNLKVLMGIESPTTALWIIVWIVGIIGSIYALFGGLRSVAVSDTLNGIGLLTGGFLIVYFGLVMVAKVGNGHGIIEGMQILKNADPEKFNSIGGAKQSVPFFTIFTGIMLLNLFYWCTNQQIIQRTFAAKSLTEGQKGVLLTGGLKLLGPLYLVIPGIIAYYLYQKGIINIGLKPNGDLNSDAAYGLLVSTVLPPYLTGFFAAVMVGAILSSFNSALNSTCTLFSLGLYKNILKKDASEHQIVKSSKVFGWIIAATAMMIAPLLANTGSIFAYLQKMNGIYFIPIFAVVLVGITTKRVPAIAARIGLVAGFIIIAMGYFVPPFDKVVETMHEFHFLGAVFAVIIATMLIIGKVIPRKEDFVQEDVKAVNLNPWKYAKLTGLLLIIIVILIYAKFADFSILTSGHTPPKITNGYVTSVGTGKDEIKIVVVKGTPYEMGFQLGVLLKDDIKATLNNFFEATRKETPKLPIEKILDKAWKINSKYIDRRVLDEMKGVADGSGASLKLLQRCHMIPVVSPYACSGMAVWGDSTKNGHTYQIRNLDYSVTSKLQEHPVVVIYIPTKGIPHANITFAGYIASHTGMNANHIVFGEKGASSRKEFPYDLNGTHFSFLFRALEYDAKTLDKALDIIKKTPLIKRYYLYISDGNEKTMGAAKIRVSTPDPIKLTIWKDNDLTDNVTPNIFSNCVYQTMNNKKAQEIIKKYLGKFDEKYMIELSKAVAAKHNLMNVVYDDTTLEMWIAYADGFTNACEQNYVHLNMNDYIK